MNINRQYKKLLSTLVAGNSVSPRGMKTHEVLGFQSLVDMNDPRVDFSARNISKSFQHAEAAWILSGDNRVSAIKPFNKNIVPYADDGHRYFGAYGPKVMDQISFVVAKLIQDRDSRQAVINIWRENPPQTKDVPCTLSLQFLIRNNQLWCIATMRSSDAWLGWPYDVFNFSMIARAVLIYRRQLLGLGEKHIHIGLGNLILTAGSQHAYEENFSKIQDVLSETVHDTTGGIYLSPDSYVSVDDFVEQLWAIARQPR